MSPIKAKSSPFCADLSLLIPNMITDDYHDPLTRKVLILARPPHGLSVKQLFQLMVGSLPEHLICHQKPVGVRYSSVFVVVLHV